MRIGACGMCCDVCTFLAKGACTGCFSGTDEAAMAKLEEFKEDGFYCPAMECAIKSKVAYCLACEKIPCKVLHEGETPYSRKFLDGGLTLLRNRVKEVEGDDRE
ncbi:hypothetical protein ACFLTJ_03930 [Chloroflexota bacterium]